MSTTDQQCDVVIEVEESTTQTVEVITDGGPPGPIGPPGQWTQMTQAEFDALDPPDPNTLYVIVG